MGPRRWTNVAWIVWCWLSASVVVLVCVLGVNASSLSPSSHNSPVSSSSSKHAGAENAIPAGSASQPLSDIEMIDTWTTSEHHQNQVPTSSPIYSDQWAVHVEGGKAAADVIADKHGFDNLGEIVPDVYHFRHRRVAKRSADPAHHHHGLLKAEPQVRWAQQQVVKRRVKRDFIELEEPEHVIREREARWSSSKGAGRPSRRAGQTSNNRPRSVQYYCNDPRWPQMWYLNRGNGMDMNVQEAWAEGITGKGVVVTILDDGLEKDHPDLRANYDPLASYDVNGHDDDPMPRYDLIDSNRHGTRCAGEVAAEANNSLCALGIAHGASIGGVRMLDGDVTDAVEARSLSLNPQHIDIYSASWGPDDDGKTVDGPGELATRAFIEGVTKGRGGKGSIFVWASGNGGRDHDNCNCDGYTNSIWTLSISSATENGFVPWYSEACSSTLATTYSSGSAGEKQIVTTDLHHSCTASHTGTSASAPLAAAICALALQANRELTWRDMQHIVVRSAKPANLKADDWQTNGVGRNVSHSFGYGLMDSAAMVRLARQWVTVPPQQHCEIRAPDTNKLIPAKSQVTLQLSITGCQDVNYIEHLQARITLAAVSRGDLQIFLQSPSGTKSTLLALRPHDSSRNGFHSWPFMSVHFWGEQPFGEWKLEIHNEGRFLGRATLHEWSLKIYGTATNPERSMRTAPASQSPPSSSSSSSLRTTPRPKPHSPSANDKLTLSNRQQQKQNPKSANYPAKSELSSVVSPTTTPAPLFRGGGSNPPKAFVKSAPLPPPSQSFGNVTPISSSQAQSPLRVKANVSQSRHESALRPKATLSEWNVVIYGTKESPDAIQRAAIQEVEAVDPMAAVEKSKDIHQNVEDNRASVDNLQMLLDVVKPGQDFAAKPALSSSSSSLPSAPSSSSSLNAKVVPNQSPPSVPPPVSSSAASVTTPPSIPGCIEWSEPGHQCLACEAALHLLENACIHSCPDGMFVSNVTLASGNRNSLCLPCHYSCLLCSGPNDYDCLACHLDADFRVLHNRDTNPERYCQPKSLLAQLASSESWFLAVQLALAFHVVLVVALMTYIACSKGGCGSSCTASCCRRGGKKSSGFRYHNIVGFGRRVRVKEFKDENVALDPPLTMGVDVDGSEEEM